MGVTREDVVLGFLPAFHSFGMTVTGLLPLLTGMRVVRHPDPTDAVGLRAQDRGLRRHHAGRHADLRPPHPGPGDAGRPRLAPAARRRGGEVPAGLCRALPELAPKATIAGGLRHHGVFAGRCRSTRRRPRDRLDRQAAAGRGRARRRSGQWGGAAGGADGHDPGQRADGLPRLPRPRRPVAVRGGRRDGAGTSPATSARWTPTATCGSAAGWGAS